VLVPWQNTKNLPVPKLSEKEQAEYENYVRAKKKKLRFYVDADVPRQAVEILREWGFNVLTAGEAGKKGHSDEDHLAEARKQSRILVSRDRDYLNDRRFPIHECPALVVCDFGTGTRDQIMDTFQCLELIESAPDFFAAGVKIDAKTSEWTEIARVQEGYTTRNRFRLYRGERQVWVD
jgi:predicted nuclease of predicted toxin-antitoxin system